VKRKTAEDFLDENRKLLHGKATTLELKVLWNITQALSKLAEQIEDIQSKIARI
jgi:hypothetical protein